MARILLEIVASTVNDCRAAESGGADRVELCAAIGTGGLTPSLGTLIETKKRVRIPLMAMLRPRAGGFCYSEEEFVSMRRDAALLVEHGADGIVFGILHSDGTVDAARCGKLVEIANGRQTVFHRAFDAVPEPMRSLDEIIDLGFTRVLTAGQTKTAHDGRARLRELIERAARRIEILPGGGIRSHNVGQLVAATGCSQVPPHGVFGALRPVDVELSHQLRQPAGRAIVVVRVRGPRGRAAHARDSGPNWERHVIPLPRRR